jgi:pyrroline-5-carboxylate reductase
MGRKVVLVGCGNMGYAMLKGWLSAGKLAADDIAVVEPNEALRGRAETHEVKTATTAGELSGTEADLVVFAVKPQVIRNVVQQYRHLAAQAAVESVANEFLLIGQR